MQPRFRTLTRAEEEIMRVLWRLGKAFVKEIVEEMPAPKPHYNTVSTIIKILHEKGFVGYEGFGKSNRYYPLIDRAAYSRGSVNQLVEKYFNGSLASMLSFFVREKDLSIEELEATLKELKKHNSKK